MTCSVPRCKIAIMSEEQYFEEKPKGKLISPRLKNFLLFVLLVAVIIASFWLSFQLGRRMLVPSRKISERRIEVPILEPPPSLKSLQELPKVSPEAKAKEIPVKKPRLQQREVKPKRYFYKIQAGLFKDKKDAQALAERIKAGGIEVVVKKVDGKWRVQAGAFSRRARAEVRQGELKSKGFDSEIIFE